MMQSEHPSEIIQSQTDGVYRTKYGSTLKLTSFNYCQWARSIQIFLRAENALAITLGEEPEPPAQQVQRRSDWIMREGKVLAIIYNSCTMVTQEHVEDGDRARAMWDMLKEKFDSNNSRAGQLEVRRSFNQSCVQSAQTIEDYIAVLLRYRKTLAGTDNAITEETFKAHLLSTLPKSYDNYVDILMEQQDEHTIDSLIQRLLEREKTLQSHSGENTSANTAMSSGSALTVRHAVNHGISNPNLRLASQMPTRSGRGRGVYRGKGSTSHPPWRARHGGAGRRSGGTWVGRGMNCWHCGKEGHRQSECRTLNREGSARSRMREQLREQDTGVKSSTDTSYVSMATSDRYALAVKASTGGPASLDRLWIVDSGASNHIANRREDFLTDKLLNPPRRMHFGDNSWVLAIGIGNVRLYLVEQGCHITIEALHVPVMSLSLVSVGCLCATMNVCFNELTCQISRRNQRGLIAFLARLDTSCGLWKIIGGPGDNGRMILVNLSAAGLAAPPTLERWHQRLGHLNIRAVKALIPIANRDSNDAFSKACSMCISTKQQRKFARMPVLREVNPLSLYTETYVALSLSLHMGVRVLQSSPLRVILAAGNR